MFALQLQRVQHPHYMGELVLEAEYGVFTKMSSANSLTRNEGQNQGRFSWPSFDVVCSIHSASVSQHAYTHVHPCHVTLSTGRPSITSAKKTCWAGCPSLLHRYCTETSGVWFCSALISSLTQKPLQRRDCLTHMQCPVFILGLQHGSNLINRS